MTTAFDQHERSQWAGQGEAYRDTFAALCAGPVGDLLDAAGVPAGVRLVDGAGAGTGARPLDGVGARPLDGVGARALGGTGVGPVPGADVRLLDVGAGAGTVAAAAAERGARVTAVDAEPSMVRLTRERVPAADVREATLPDLPFADGAFDATVANFVLNHVGDPAAALAELIRLTRGGGRVAVTIWPYPQSTALGLWADIFDAAQVQRPAGLPRLAPENDFPRTVDGLAELLRRAGLGGVRCRLVHWTHRTDAQTWWNGPAAGLSTPGLVLRQQDGPTVARIREHYDRLTAPYTEPDSMLALPASALLAVGVVE